MHRLHRPSALAGAVLTLALASCGSETYTYTPGAQPAQESASNAPALSEAAAVAPTRGRVSPADAAALTRRMEAAMAKVRTAHFTWASGSLSATGDVAFSEGLPAMRATFGGFGPYTADGILVDGEIYLSLDGFMRPGTYYRATPTDALSRDAVEQSRSLDPNRLPDTLKAASGDLRLVGAEELYGAPVTHYRSMVDFTAVKGLVSLLPKGTPTRVDYDLWLDDQALVRRLELKCGCENSWMEFTDWGKKVDISRPPASALVPAP